MTILVLGDANADLSAAIQRFPAEGDDSPVASLAWGSGGSAANVAAALALLGASARLLARVGRDPAAETALRIARAAGADLGAIQIDDTLATGLCFAAVSPGGERSFFSYRGANAGFEFGPSDARILADAHWLHVSGYALLEGRQRVSALALIEAATQHAIPISLDLCLPQLRVWRDDTLRLLPRIRILFANEPELAALAADRAKGAEDTQLDPLSGRGDAAISSLLECGVAIVAAKLGPHGCLIGHSNMRHYAPAFSVQPVDTNGCGDAFVAGFLFGYTRGAPLESCAALANAIGALKAARCGAADALPSRDMLRAFLAEHQKDALLVDLPGD
jgi:sugar/nucleoside kinase (ribokinase family)